MVDASVDRFDESSNAENPLPNHTDNRVDVRAGRGLVVSDSGGSHGDFHHERGSETQESVEFKALVQDMRDDKGMKLCEEIKEEENMRTMLAKVHSNDIYEDTNEKGPY
ncbi:hypothetical protein GOBAR_DD03541 [Gossypium barbadense]|nr:hypothetical protein GOBAR_DD03541 [Gossypium barbadense]